MQVTLHGGFAEKGRTCLAVESRGYRVLLDAGVKTSATGTHEYYPAITPEELRATDAMIVTHAHEDHVGAMGWCMAQGFRGRVFMTAETWRDADACLRDYATQEEYALARQVAVEPLSLGPAVLALGPLRIGTGRSGHMGGCVWCSLDDGTVQLVYCGDIVPASAVFAFDPVPRADAIVIDASYGDDNTAQAQRVAQIAQWIAAHPRGCVLPTPLHGRSAELLAAIDAPVALAPGMRDALASQLDAHAWLVPEQLDALATRLLGCPDWLPDDPLPRAALLCHDGMGLQGPSRSILESAARTGHPALFTGHLPANSPGEKMVREGRGAWIRLPTHPRRDENITLAAAAGAALVIGHSCERSALQALKPHIRQLDVSLATGSRIVL